MVLLCAEFALLRSKVVAMTFPTPVRGFRVAGATVSAYSVVKSNLLCQLLLDDIGDGHV
jgi:hypothetical protein